MTAFILGLSVSKLQVVYRPLMGVLDAFAQARMRNAVPEWQLRKARREIKRYRRSMHPEQKLAANTISTGR
jgi:hypothetical protein